MTKVTPGRNLCATSLQYQRGAEAQRNRKFQAPYVVGFVEGYS